jgi:hypothetical protein
MDYKTPIYQRNAYERYYQKNKDNEEFKQKRRETAKKSYEKKKELKRLAKLKLKLVDESENKSSESE